MSNYARRYQVLVVLTILIVGCNKEQAADFILPDFPDNRMAIIGFLGNHEQPILDVSAIATFSEEAFDANIIDAVPILWEDGLPIDTFQYFSCNCERRLQGAYIGKPLNLVDGKNYRLSIAAEGYETASVEFPVFKQVFATNPIVYGDTLHGASLQGGVLMDVNLIYQINRDIDFGYIDLIQHNSFFGLLSNTSRFFTPSTFGVWSKFELETLNRPAPFTDGVIDSVSYQVNTPHSPERFQTNSLMDGLSGYHLYAVHLTNESLEAMRDYLRNTVRESPGGAFVEPQVLENNVENGYGYVMMVDMVGGRAVIR